MKQMMKAISHGQEYRTIRVHVMRYASGHCSRIAAELNASFSRRDLFFVAGKNYLEMYFRRVDIRRLRMKLKELHAGSEFENVVDELERIGSYGVRSRKRVFVGYAAERKVRERDSKRRTRGAFSSSGDAAGPEDHHLPEEYRNRLICGDSEMVLRRLPDNCIDLIFTSPPYNFGLEYGRHMDTERWGAYFRKLSAIFGECIRVLKHGGRIIVNVQPLFSDYVPAHHIISNYFLEKGLIWKGEIIWEKHNYNCKYTAWGSWKSPVSPYLRYSWEFLEIFCKGSIRHPGNADDADIAAEEFKKWVYSRWDIAPERRMKELEHPAVFPEELAERAIKLFTFRGDTVLDPFSGVGTTACVASRLQRTFVGIDISPEYTERARRRLEDCSGI